MCKRNIYTSCWVKLRILWAWLRKTKNHLHCGNIHLYNMLEARLQGAAVICGVNLQASNPLKCEALCLKAPQNMFFGWHCTKNNPTTWLIDILLQERCYERLRKYFPTLSQRWIRHYWCFDLFWCFTGPVLQVETTSRFVRFLRSQKSPDR